METKRLLSLIGKPVGGVFAELGGSSHYFSRSHADFEESGITGANPLTIQLWIKPGSIAGEDILVAKWGVTGGKRMYMLSRVAAELRFYTSANGSAQKSRNTTNASLEVGQWYHVAVTYDASDTSCKFYLNGELLTDDGTALDATIADKDANFTVGTFSEGSSSWWYGGIFNVALFDDMRTAPEILASAVNRGEDLSGAGNIIGQWTFDDAAAATRIDNIQGDAGRDLDLVGGDTTNYGTHTRAIGALP